MKAVLLAVLLVTVLVAVSAQRHSCPAVIITDPPTVGVCGGTFCSTDQECVAAGKHLCCPSACGKNLCI